MNRAQQDELKAAIDRASDTLAGLAHLMNRLPIDVRNLRHDMQATGEIDLSQLEQDGKALKLHITEAMAAYKTLYGTVRDIQGGK